MFVILKLMVRVSKLHWVSVITSSTPEVAKSSLGISLYSRPALSLTDSTGLAPSGDGTPVTSSSASGPATTASSAGAVGASSAGAAGAGAAGADRKSTRL